MRQNDRTIIRCYEVFFGFSKDEESDLAEYISSVTSYIMQCHALPEYVRNKAGVLPRFCGSESFCKSRIAVRDLHRKALSFRRDVNRSFIVIHTHDITCDVLVATSHNTRLETYATFNIPADATSE